MSSFFYRTPAPPNPASQAQEPKSPEAPPKRANQAEEKERAKTLQTQCKEMDCCGDEAMGYSEFKGGLPTHTYIKGTLQKIIEDDPPLFGSYKSKAEFLDKIESNIEACKNKQEQKSKIIKMLELSCWPSTRFRLQTLLTNNNGSNMHELEIIEKDIEQMCMKKGGRKSKKPKRKKITRQRR